MNTRLAAILTVSAALVHPMPMLWAGEVYRSVDAQGHVVYSDQPDMSVAQTRVDIADPNVYSDDGARSSETPPPLEDYEQPPCPEDGYLWTPGYWAWSASGYFWVPGDWVLPPRVGVLWTPGYWEYLDAVYVFHRGYWATYVGYYGGINYGFGYFGSGFAGGRWAGNSFVYDRDGYSRSAHTQVSYHGGRGGTSLGATPQELARGREPHIAPTLQQRRILVQAATVARPAPPRRDSIPAIRAIATAVLPVQREAVVRTVPSPGMTSRPAASPPRTPTTRTIRPTMASEGR
jgi:Domain of unknown function (DUF4124)/WXXGXW repeat (2 copies)